MLTFFAECKRNEKKLFVGLHALFYIEQPPGMNDLVGRKPIEVDAAGDLPARGVDSVPHQRVLPRVSRFIE